MDTQPTTSIAINPEQRMKSFIGIVTLGPLSLSSAFTFTSVVKVVFPVSTMIYISIRRTSLNTMPNLLSHIQVYIIQMLLLSLMVTSMPVMTISSLSSLATSLQHPLGFWICSHFLVHHHQLKYLTLIHSVWSQKHGKKTIIVICEQK